MREYYAFWRVLDPSPSHVGAGDHHRYWQCQCVCSVKKHVREDDLKSGKSKSCGCRKSTKLLNDVGKRFNRWEILAIEDVKQGGHRYVSVRCDCGYLATRRLSSIKQGASKSCGCIPKTRRRNDSKRTQEL